MTQEEKLDLLINEIRQLRSEMHTLLSDERLIGMMSAIIHQKLSRFQSFVSAEIEELFEALPTQAQKPKEKYPEPENDRQKNTETLEQTLISDPYQGKFIQYAGIPTSNNTFLERVLYNHLVPRKTYYRIIRDRPQDTEGVLDLVTDIDTLTTAFHIPDSNLSACELRGIGTISYDKMKSRHPGRVQQDGPNWVIERKIIIEYGE